MMPPKRLVAVDGLEGVGKTSAIGLLAKLSEFMCVKSPPAEFNPIRHVFESEEHAASRFYFYLAGLLHAQEDAKRLANGRSVVFDRFWLSTWAYRSEAAVTVGRPEEFGIDRPAIQIILDCSDDIRKRRIAGRGFHIFDRNVTFDEVKIRKYFLDHADIVIDTSELDTQGTADKIRAAIS